MAVRPPYLDAYITAASVADDLKGYLFRSIRGKTRQLTTNLLAQADVYLEYLPAYAPVEYIWGCLKHHAMPHFCAPELGDLQ